MGEDERELRVAPVMTGGTSLAVWMGGVTTELHRVVRARDVEAPGDATAPMTAEIQRTEGQAVYRFLQELTGTRTVVDVITGTSAGGLNGTLLAVALARGASVEDFARLRDTWQRVADLELLLRPRKEVDPPSLLQGEASFQKELRSVLADLYEGDRSRAAEVDLVTTLTTIEPIRTSRVDSFGEVMTEASHAQRLRFTAKHLAPGTDDPKRLDKLALAARTSASIPGVFEPAFIEVSAPGTEPDPSKVDLSGHASFTTSRWAVDGGVVVNLPLTEALDRIYERRARGEVRRVVLYVNPTPSADATNEPDDPETTPSLARSVATIALAPRAEGVSADLDQIERRNRAVERQVQVRAGIGMVGAKLTVTPALFQEYRRRRARSSVERMLTHALQDGPRLDARVWAAQVDRFLPARTALFPADVNSLEPVDRTEGRRDRWGWGIEPVDHAVSVAIGLVSRILSLGGGTDADRAQLRATKVKLHGYRERVRSVRALDEAYWRQALAPLASELADDAPPALPLDPSQLYAAWPYAETPGPSPSADGAAALDLAQQLLGGAGTSGNAAAAAAATAQQATGADRDRLLDRARVAVQEVLRGAFFQAAWLLWEVRDAATAVLGVERADAAALRAEAIERELDALLPSVGDDDAGISGVDDARLWQRLLRIHVLQSLLLGELVPREQQVDLVQLSSNTATTPTALDGRTSADKLAGPELARLGAFLKPAWRANDWFWGRLDGAHRLVLLLLEPDQLRRQEAQDTLRDWITDLAAPAPVPTPVREELSRLKGSEPMGSLPLVAAFLAEQVQLAIARTELPRIAEAIEAVPAPSRSEPDGGAFRRAVAAQTGTDDRLAPGTSDADVARLVARLQIGEETLGDELGYGLLTRTAARAASVGLNALTSTKAGIPVVGRFLRPLRAPAHAVASVAEHLTSASPLRRALGIAVAAVAAATIALRLLGGDVGAPAVIGAIAVLTVLTVTAMLRNGFWRYAAVLVGMVAVLTLTLIGGDVEGLVYTTSPPAEAFKVAKGQTIRLDGSGTVRVRSGADKDAVLDDVPVEGRSSLTISGTAGHGERTPGEESLPWWKAWGFTNPISLVRVVALLAALVTAWAARIVAGSRDDATDGDTDPEADSTAVAAGGDTTVRGPGDAPDDGDGEPSSAREPADDREPSPQVSEREPFDATSIRGVAALAALARRTADGVVDRFRSRVQPGEAPPEGDEARARTRAVRALAALAAASLALAVSSTYVFDALLTGPAPAKPAGNPKGWLLRVAEALHEVRAPLVILAMVAFAVLLTAAYEVGFSRPRRRSLAVPTEESPPPAAASTDPTGAAPPTEPAGSTAPAEPAAPADQDRPSAFEDPGTTRPGSSDPP